MNGFAVVFRPVRVYVLSQQGDFFVVLKEENDYVFLCDGKRRMLEKTKKKKLKHIFATRTVLNEEDLQTNRKIRKALREFRK